MQLYIGPCHMVSEEIAVTIPYSPDLTPLDFFLLPKMKHLTGELIANDDLKDAVVTWLNSQEAT